MMKYLRMGKANYFSPCNAIIQVNKEQGPLVEKLGIIANLIDISDFCICDLSTTPLADKIREYATHGSGTILLDTSKEYIQEEWPSLK